MKNISIKERMFTSEILGLTSVYAKKSAFYGEMASDEEVKEKLKSLSNILLNNYDELLGILEG